MQSRKPFLLDVIAAVRLHEQVFWFAGTVFELFQKIQHELQPELLLVRVRSRLQLRTLMPLVKHQRSLIDAVLVEYGLRELRKKNFQMKQAGVLRTRLLVELGPSVRLVCSHESVQHHHCSLQCERKNHRKRHPNGDDIEKRAD